MSDQALQNAHRLRDEALSRLDRAKADLAQAQEAIAVAKADLEKVNGFITLWHEFADGTAGTPADSEPAARSNVIQPANAPDLAEVASEPRRGKRPRGNPKKEVVAGIAREIIQAKNAPMPRSELFAALRDRGIEIKGSDPEMVFSTMLWRMPTAIVRLPEFGYWLPERVYGPAGYVPGVQRTMIDKEEYDMNIADGTGQLPDIDSDDEDVEQSLDKHDFSPLTLQEQEEAALLTHNIALADIAYHRDDAPTASDAEYDEWKRRLASLEEKEANSPA